MINTMWIIHPEASVCGEYRSRLSGVAGLVVHQTDFVNVPSHDAFVTAGNAFGIMTAGIDAAVVSRFGTIVMERVQNRIMDEYLGEQPVGTAFVVPTGSKEIPYLVHAPTMRVPGSIEKTDKIYAATWAALLAVQQFNLTAEAKIETVAFPAMGTGFGGVSPSESARQMGIAWKHYCEPPHRLDWDFVARRQLAICYDGDRQVIR